VPVFYIAGYDEGFFKFTFDQYPVPPPLIVPFLFQYKFVFEGVRVNY